MSETTTASRFLVYGEDEFLVSKKAKAIADDYIPEADRDMALDIIDGRADNVDHAVQIIKRAQEAVATPSFFSPRKLVWIRQANFLSDTVIGRSENVKTPLGLFVDYIKTTLPEGHAILISAPKADKRYTLFKTFKALGELHAFDVPERGGERHAQAQLDSLLRESGLTMARDVRETFLERVGNDTRQMVMEIEKLALYVGDRKAVSRDDVRTMTSSSREALAWDLSDAFGDRNLSSALYVVRMLFAQKESHIRLIAVLEGRIRDLLLYREALDAGWLAPGSGGMKWAHVPPEVDHLMKNAYTRDPRKTHPYRIKVLAGQAGNFAMIELRRIQRDIAQAHTKLVSSSLPPHLVFELALTRALARPARRA